MHRGSGWMHWFVLVSCEGGQEGSGSSGFFWLPALQNIFWLFFFLLNFERWKESLFLCILPMQMAFSGFGREMQEQVSSASTLGLFLVYGWLGDFFLPLPKRESHSLLGREFSPVHDVFASLSPGISCACRKSPLTLGEAGKSHRALGFRAKAGWVQDRSRNCPKEVTCIKSRWRAEQVLSWINRRKEDLLGKWMCSMVRI